MSHEQQTKTLQSIVQDHKSLDELMIEQGGELTDEQQEQIVDSWMNEIKQNIATKADNYQYRMNTLENASESLRARAKMMASAAKVLENMQDGLKVRMKLAMQEIGVTELIGNDFKFKLSESKPSVQIIDSSKIPAQYTREKIVIDYNKDEIKEALQNGAVIDGACLQTSFTLRVSVNKKVKELN